MLCHCQFGRFPVGELLAFGYFLAKEDSINLLQADIVNAILSHFLLQVYESRRLQVTELVKHLEKEGFKAVSNVQLPLKRLMLTFGIGSMGRNSLVVIDGLGSAFHVQALLTDASFQYSYYKEVQPVLGKRCGNCLSCVMACPTGAISADGHVEAAKCLRAVSEMDIIPQEYEPLLKNRLLGCDVCQNVCPANARLCTAEPVEVTLKSLLDGNIDGLKRLIGSNYARVNKLKKKAAVIAANNRRYDLIDELENMRLSADSSVAYAAERAIKRMEEEV